jgi:hypothetical protein
MHLKSFIPKDKFYQMVILEHEGKLSEARNRGIQRTIKKSLYHRLLRQTTFARLKEKRYLLGNIPYRMMAKRKPWVKFPH